jgi:hypothetical protein
MLSVEGRPPGPFRGGVSRREFLKVGTLGLSGLTLADLLRLKARGAVRPDARSKSVIMVYLPGGPSHIDMYDLKPDAPGEFRGEFKPIQTNVPGLDLCELMPLQAGMADKLAVVRGLKTYGFHDSYELLTTDRAAVTGQNPSNPLPAFGCFVSRLRGVNRDVPPYVGIKNMRLAEGYDDPETTAFLGAAYQPFRTSGPGLANLSLPDGVTTDRLANRKTLLRSFDRLQRSVTEGNESLSGIDGFTSQALEMLTSSRVRDAFDLGREPDRVRETYGEATDFLLARRLVEAGVSVVTLPCRIPVRIGDGVGEQANHWDTHAHNFKFLRLMLPRYDRAVSALVNDLYQRGLDQDVTVVVWGEFGRRPKIGDVTSDGRGHWPEAGFALMSGGGVKTGRIAGATDARGERALGRPFRPADVLATLYHALGIDPSLTFPDQFGRPRYILDDREPIRELL